jgi:ribosomal protein S24E
MDLQITTQKDNVLLSRNEVTAKIQFEGATPARKIIQKALAKELKAKEPMVIIQQIATEYGSPFATVKAYAYSDETAMQRLERKNLLEKHIGHEPKQEAEE